jgi:nucleoside-diphosphate-sugar epimerase
LAATPPAPGVINFSSGRNISNAALFDAIAAACDHRFTCKHPLAGYQTPPRIDNRRFVETFGFQPLSLLDRIPALFPGPQLS